MKKISVLPNKHKELNLESISQIVSMITESGAKALMDNDFKQSGIEAEYVDNSELGNADMLVVLGGDGTILGAAREFCPYKIPVLGINHGRLGFLAEIEKSDEESFRKVLRGEYTVEKHTMLDINIGEKSFCALNDAVIHRGGFSRMLKFVLYIEDIAVNEIMSDGLIVSTPTGSTAYSFSAGGPIVDPSLDVLLVTPICPHDLNSRSIILPSHKTVRIVIEEAESNESMLTIDGQTGHMLSNGDEIKINGGGKVGLVRAEGSVFYEKLRRKLFNKNNGGC